MFLEWNSKQQNYNFRLVVLHRKLLMFESKLSFIEVHGPNSVKKVKLHTYHIVSEAIKLNPTFILCVFTISESKKKLLGNLFYIQK